MSGEIVQRVRTIFTASGSGLRREVDSISGQLRRLQQIALGIAGGYGIGRVIRGLVEVNAAAETGAIGIATMVQAADRMRGRMTPFNAALGLAKSTMEDLRKVAVDTPATFDQVGESFKSILMPARAAGLDMKTIAQLAGDVATADISEGGTGLIARDIAQMLRGRNDADSAFLRPYAQEIMKSVRGGDQAGALRTIQRAVQIDPQARKAFGESFEGRMSTFKDQIEAVKRAAGAPLFKVANEQLGKMSEWLSKNKDEVERIATAVGQGLVTAFEKVKSALVWMYENREKIIEWAKVLVGATLLGKAVGLVNTLVAGLNSMIALAPSLGGALLKALGPLALLAGFMGRGILPDDELPGGLRPMTPDEKRQVARSPEAMAFAREMERREKASAIRKTEEKLAALDDTKVLRGHVVVGTVLSEGRRRALSAAEAEDARRRGALSVVGKKGYLPRESLSRTTNNIDARGSKIQVTVPKIETDDPSRFADVALKGAFIGLTSHTLSASFGLGAPKLATGAP